MSAKTYFYRTVITITDTNDHLLGLPRLREITIQNIGDNNCQIELDNAVSSGSITASANGATYTWGFGPNNLYYKASGNTTLLVTGTRQYKE